MEFIHQVAPSIDEHEIASMDAYLRSGGWLTEFEKTQQFEGLIAQSVQAKHASVVNNGTISLTLALMALGIRNGDEVIVPDLTMIASPNAVTLLGAKPVLADIREEDLCLDLEQVKAKLTKRTRAVMYVNFNGRGAQLPEFVDFCRERGLFLLEDAAQAMGSRTGGRFHGTFGDIGSFSFSPHKIITTGQGGALVTNNTALYEKIEKIKDFGRAKGGADYHDEFGINSKFTDIQAVIGIEQIKKLPARIAKKRWIFAKYRELLADVEQVNWIQTDLDQTSPWFMDAFVPSPDELAQFLKSRGVGSRRIYPPIHSQKIFGLSERFPVTAKFSARGLWLPSSLDLTEETIQRIAAEIRSFYKAAR